MSTMFAATASGSFFTALPAELGIVDPISVVKSYFTQQVQHSNASPPVPLLESYFTGYPMSTLRVKELLSRKGPRLQQRVHLD